MTKKQVIFYLTVILILAGIFRFWQLDSAPPGLYPDEAMNGNNALEALDAGNFKLFYPENNGREGLFINIQALSLAIFGNEPWALRGVSAIFGILTVLGLFLLTKELFGTRPALFASFFLATSFWHVMFSRIGFRAIMAPFFLVWSMWLLWKISNPEQKNLKLKIIILSAVSGLLFGLGFHTYIAYRIMPLLLIFPFIFLWKNNQKKLIAFFLLGAFLAGLPLGLYFLGHPADFFGRTSQISVFSAESPLKDLGMNILKTAGMFFVIGDYNWRHNLAGSPQLWWPVGILFLIGILWGFKKLFTRGGSALSGKIAFLFAWIALALAPVVISSEGIPHALRAILAIPPVLIFAALALEVITSKSGTWLLKQADNFPELRKKIMRIKKESVIFLFVFLIAVSANSFVRYFITWANSPHTYDAFSGRYVELGNYLNIVPAETEKYVIINSVGVLVKNLPMPSQTIMFITDTYTKEKQNNKNFYYLLATEIEKIKCLNSCVVITLENDPYLREEIKQIVPDLKLNIEPKIEVLYKN